MLRPFLKSGTYMRMNQNRDQDIYKKISNQNLNQWLKISKTSYTKRSVNNQMVQKFVSVLEGNLSKKNAPKLSAKYLQGKRCKIKQKQNIPVTLRTFLN